MQKIITSAFPIKAIDKLNFLFIPEDTTEIISSSFDSKSINLRYSLASSTASSFEAPFNLKIPLLITVLIRNKITRKYFSNLPVQKITNDQLLTCTETNCLLRDILLYFSEIHPCFSEDQLFLEEVYCLSLAPLILLQIDSS